MNYAEIAALHSSVDGNKSKLIELLFDLLVDEEFNAATHPLIARGYVVYIILNVIIHFDQSIATFLF